MNYISSESMQRHEQADRVLGDLHDVLGSAAVRKALGPDHAALANLASQYYVPDIHHNVITAPPANKRSNHGGLLPFVVLDVDTPYRIDRSLVTQQGEQQAALLRFLKAKRLPERRAQSVVKEIDSAFTGYEFQEKSSAVIAEVRARKCGITVENDGDYMVHGTPLTIFQSENIRGELSVLKRPGFMALHELCHVHQTIKGTVEHVDKTTLIYADLRRELEAYHTQAKAVRAIQGEQGLEHPDSKNICYENTNAIFIEEKRHEANKNYHDKFSPRSQMLAIIAQEGFALSDNQVWGRFLNFR